MNHLQLLFQPVKETIDRMAAIEELIQAEEWHFSRTPSQEVHISTQRIGKMLQEVGAELKTLQVKDQHILREMRLLALSHDLLVSRVQFTFNKKYKTASTATPGDLAQVKKTDIALILNDWVHAAAGEQRQKAADRITEFLGSTHATALDLSNLGLTSLPPIFQSEREFSTRLQSLKLDGNKLVTLPAEIGALQALTALDLHNNELRVLPGEIGQLRALIHLYLGRNRLNALPRELGRLQKLQTLIISDNKLRVLPAAIGQLRALQDLFVGNNFLEALPIEIGQLQALGILGLNNNKLSELPETVSQLQALKSLGLMDNYLTALPAAIGQLQALRNFLLSGNNALQGLPNELLCLHPSCIVDLTGTGLSSAVLGRLGRACCAAGYEGPRIQFSIPEARSKDGKTKPIQESLGELFSLAKMEPREFPMLMQQDETNSGNLANWLHRLSDTQDYRKEGQRQRTLAQKILSYLELAENSPEFQGRFFRVIERATETCGDRVSLSILHLGIAYAFATADPADISKLADLIIQGSWSIDQLEKIAREKVKALPFVDEIEVYLAYPIRLKERLGLYIDIEGMLYFRCSQVTEQDLNQAAEFIESQLAAPDAKYNILIRYPEWIQALESNYSQECKTLRIRRSQLLEKASIAEIQQWYHQKLVALTKRALGIVAGEGVHTSPD